MTMRMLIDGRHQEETRVAVVQGSRIEEFDFESAERKQLKGNIYLAKVTRVEPSLQAAFVEYGGNRHGFLAFSEIHPDYYQIPKEDREALLREEAEHAAEEEALRGHDDYDDDDGEVREASSSDADEQDEDQGDEPVDQPTAEGAGAAGEGDAVDSLRKRRMSLRRRYKIQDVIRRRQVLLVQVVKEERGNKGAALTTYLSLAGRYCVLMPNTSHGGGISRKISNAADRKRLKSIMAELNLPKSMGCIVRTAGLQRTKTEIKRDFDYLARLWDEIREKTLSSAAPAEIHGDSDLIKRAIRDIYNRDIEEVIVEGDETFRAARAYMKLLMPSHVKKVRPYVDPVPLFQRFGVEDQLNGMYHPLVQLKSGGYLVINPTEALVSIDINSGRSTREHNIEQTATATNLEAAQEIARQLRLRDMAGLVVIDFIDMENNSNVRKVEKAMKEALKNDRARIQIGRISSFGLMEMSRQRLRTGVLEASTRQCPHCEGTGLVRTASSAGLNALRMLEDEAAHGRGTRLVLRCSQEAAFYVLNKKRHELFEIEDRYGVSIEIMPDGSMEGARMQVEVSGPPPAAPPKLAPMTPMPEDDDEDIVEEDEDEEEIFGQAEEAEPLEEDRGDRAPARDTREREDADGETRRRRRRRRRRGGRREEGERSTEGEADEAAEEGAPQEFAADDAGSDVAEAMEAVGGGDDAADNAGEEDQRGSRRGRRGRRSGRRREGARGDQVPADAQADQLPGEERPAEDQPLAGEPVFEASGDPSADEQPQPVDAVDADPAFIQAAAPEERAEDKPKARRRPRARKADAAEPAPAAVDEPDAVPAGEAELPLETEAPAAKPRRSRRKAAEPAPGEMADAPAADAEETPKPKRARRKAASAEPALAQAEAAPEVGPERDPETDLAPDPLIASTAEPAAEAETGASASEPRRGWWQRTFGS